MADNDRMKPTLIDVWWVVGFSAIAIGIIAGWDKLKSIRSAPIIIKEGGKNVTISIPAFVIPRKEGESTESVKSKYKPNVTRDGLEWIISVPPVQYATSGMEMSYTPDPIRVPIVPSMDMLSLALKLTPIVTPVTEPVGWKIQFPQVTVVV